MTNESTIFPGSDSLVLGHCGFEAERSNEPAACVNKGIREDRTMTQPTSVILKEQRDELARNRDNEIMAASEVLSQYVTDHNDNDAYRENERQVNRLAKAWDKMIAKLDKWIDEAEKIEASCDNFYGN